MSPAQHIAFKEWAVICAALETGRQSLILRKGGIHEGRAGFRVAHQEFWLWPTYLHEGADGLTLAARELLDETVARKPVAGTQRLSLFAAVTDVHDIQDETLLPRLEGQHLWSAETVQQRFHYRQPGLFALIVRVYRLPTPMIVPDSPHYAGCRSWIETQESLSTADLQPVLDEATFARTRQTLCTTLAPTPLA